MTRKGIVLALYAESLVSVILGSSCAAATGIRPTMRTVVTCVYNLVRSHAGMLSADVFYVGGVEAKYVIEYKFRDKGRLLTGSIGIHDGIMSDATASPPAAFWVTQIC